MSKPLRAKDLRDQARKFHAAAKLLHEQPEWERRGNIEKPHDAVAWYLAGYTVELALKAIIAKQNGGEFEAKGDFKTHDLDDLLELAGLHDEFCCDCKATPALGEHWKTVKAWKPDLRYYAKNRYSKVHPLLEAIGPEKGDGAGVWTWLAAKWKDDKESSSGR